MNDLVGRCIAEQETSAASFAVTLTYRGDSPNSAVLVYADVQRFLKRLRRRGFKVRYIVAGEYGSRKARAHWHAVLFFSGAAPAEADSLDQRQPWQIVLDTRFDWEPWPHGIVYFQQPDYGGFAYVLKYALKDLGADVSKSHLAMSKKPPLGDAFVRDLAMRYVAQGLAPQDLFYSFHSVFDAKRKRRRFMLQGVTRENFLRYFLHGWEAVHGTPAPVSEALTAMWDKQAAEERAATMTDWEWRQRRNQWPKYTPPGGGIRQDDDWEWAAFHDPAFWHHDPRPLPSAFWDYAPVELVSAALSDDPPTLEIFDCHPLPMQVQYGDNHRWLVNEPEVQAMLRDWLNTSPGA